MLKIISAALLAVSFIAAPALAAPAGKTATTPVIKAEPVKAKLLNANARMGHHKHYRHHRHHKHMGMLKTHAAPKFAVKHIAPAKRG